MDKDLRQLLDRKDNITLVNNDDKVVQAVSIVEVRITSRESVHFLPTVLETRKGRVHRSIPEGRVYPGRIQE